MMTKKRAEKIAQNTLKCAQTTRFCAIYLAVCAKSSTFAGNFTRYDDKEKSRS